jgi:4-hydroxy-2-oxoheptanedioate aldolase
MKERSLKALWGEKEVVYGAWLSIPDTITAETAARAGFDYICIDVQHGLMDYQRALHMLQALDLGTAVPIVRAPSSDASLLGKFLDAGASAVILPMINSAEEARAAVAACRYAPAGCRSFGPTRPMMREGMRYFQEANDAISVIPMIETRQAIDNIEDIVGVDGVDGVYVGPFDLQVALNLPPAVDGDAPAFVSAIDRVLTHCKRAEVVAAVHGNPQIASKRRAQGFRMITIASDVSVLRRGLQEALSIAKAR